MRRATYIHVLTLFLCGLWAVGCGHSSDRAPGPTLTIYMSLPHEGVSARIAGDVAAGARLALEDARGRAGGKRVRLVQLDSSKPGGVTWDPSLVEKNAKQAANDPTTIGYIGELDSGASAVSVPVTNDKQILQVSPGDGLTSLTRDEPGAALLTGPDRYYPSGKRTFLRLVPTDYSQAATLVGWAKARGAQRIALVQDERLFGRELAGQARYAALKLHLTATDGAEAHDDPTTYPALAQKLVQQRPDAVIYTGLGDADSGALLAAIRRALPGVPLYGGSMLATASPAPAGLPPVAVVKPALAAAAYGPRARRLLERIAHFRGTTADPEALYGYEAMRVVLDAIAAARPDAGDRAAVARAALRPRARDSVLGSYRISAGGDVSTTRFGGYRRNAGRLAWAGIQGPPAGSLIRP